MAGEKLTEQPELGRRIRAARGYASLNQPELAALLQVSEGYIRQVEGGKQLKPVNARGLIERVAEVCELPAAFFTADFDQLDPQYRPPEDQLASLEATIRELMGQLSGLAIQADRQLAEGNAKLEEFGQIILAARGGSDE
jgi:transcriptional regulator with XRE-family HTH domain